jgi:hypothetical protein
VLVGQFQTDFETVYRHPGKVLLQKLKSKRLSLEKIKKKTGHEIYHRWGEILALSGNAPTKLKSASGQTSSQLSEFTLKGYIKLDIVLQSRGDTSKVFFFTKKT